MQSSHEVIDVSWDTSCSSSSSSYESSPDHIALPSVASLSPTTDRFRSAPVFDVRYFVPVPRLPPCVKREKEEKEEEEEGKKELVGDIDDNKDDEYDDDNDIKRIKSQWSSLLALIALARELRMLWSLLRLPLPLAACAPTLYDPTVTVRHYSHLVARAPGLVVVALALSPAWDALGRPLVVVQIVFVTTP